MSGLAALAAAVACYFILSPRARASLAVAFGPALRRWAGPALAALAMALAVTGRYVPAAVLLLLGFAVIGFQAGARLREGKAQPSPPPPRRAPMERPEALAVLGLVEGASRDDIQDAYRRLMVKVHPDHGGSADLAARLNQARDVLLR